MPATLAVAPSTSKGLKISTTGSAATPPEHRCSGRTVAEICATGGITAKVFSSRVAYREIFELGLKYGGKNPPRESSKCVQTKTVVQTEKSRKNLNCSGSRRQNQSPANESSMSLMPNPEGLAES